MKFLIIVTGFNCAWNVRRCYQSLYDQTYQNWRAIFISDGSRDRTPHEMVKIHDNKVQTIISPVNMGATYQRWRAISQSGEDDETIIALLGMDDHLFSNALEVVSKQYDKGKWMTYGNWINQNGVGLPCSFDLNFSKKIHRERAYRSDVYRSTALNTFKKFLFDQIPVKDFQIDRKWITTTTESEVMFSCLEMSGKKRIGIIHEPIYHYNQNLRNGTIKRLGAGYKKEIFNKIKARPKKDLLVRKGHHESV